MELEDLRAEWAKRDAALQRTLQTQTALMRGLLAEKRLEKLRRWNLLSAVELAIYLVFVISFGAFLASNWGRWEFFVPALLLDIWTIAMGAVTFAERAKLQSVDFGAPVLDIQKRLSALQAARARAFQWAFLTGQILWWIPFFIVVMWGVFGVNLYTVSAFMPRFIVINLIVGMALVPVLLWVSHMLGPWLMNSAIGRSVLDSVTGRDLAEARAVARRLSQFEAETA
jgi:hypothetical protein